MTDATKNVRQEKKERGSPLVADQSTQRAKIFPKKRQKMPRKRSGKGPLPGENCKKKRIGFPSRWEK